MPALVIGATGLLGANLVRALLDHGVSVRVLLRRSHAAQTLNGLALDRMYGDLDDPPSIHQACRGMDVVYQAASYYPTATIPAAEACRRGLAQTDALLSAVRETGVPRLVFTSSLTTIGFPPEPGRLADETCPFVSRFPDNPYLSVKAAMEQAVLDAARAGVPAVVVNPTAFYGPYDRKPTSGTQIVMIAKRLAPGYVQAPVNAIDVRDVAEGMIAAAERGRVGERYILGNWNTTQKDLAALIAAVAGVGAPKIRIPFPVARYGTKAGEWVFRTVLRRPPPVPAFFIEALMHMQHYDCSKGIRELGYPRHPVERAIRDALTWFRENGYVKG
ncbi:NAD-dependent epimerase/dehydratase family protein [Candidatus Nitrospira bockiana]